MSTSGREEEEKSFYQKFCSAVLSEKLRQAFHWATNSEGGGVLLPDDLYTKTGITISDVLWEKHQDILFSPVEYHVRILQRV